MNRTVGSREADRKEKNRALFNILFDFSIWI